MRRSALLRLRSVLILQPAAMSQLGPGMLQGRQGVPPCLMQASSLHTKLARPPQLQRQPPTQRRWRCSSLEREYLDLTGLAGGSSADDGASGDEEQAAAALDRGTIAAIVTGAAQGAVSIIRVSGSEATAVAQQVFTPAAPRRQQQAAASALPNPTDTQSESSWRPESHRVYYGTAVATDGTVLDEVLLLAMLAPRSYTAEDVVEVHTHGGGVSAARVLQRCLEAGARLAKPGEFTLRAFLNGRLDLSQAESVGQLIDARTVGAADSALAGLSGGLGLEVQRMRLECVDLLVELDARLDFDEELPPLDALAMVDRIRSLSQQVDATLQTARHGQLLRSGLQVALVGRPNVGKSSLLNALSGTERAIVTHIAGTTRDIVEAGVVIGGIPITLLDTAGLRESADLVEQMGVERSIAAAQQADIVVMVVDAQLGWTEGDGEIAAQLFGGGSAGSNGSNLSSYEAEGSSNEGSGWGSGNEGVEVGGSKRGVPVLLVVNKTDLAQEQNKTHLAQEQGQQQLGKEHHSEHQQQQNGSMPAASQAIPPAAAAAAAAIAGEEASLAAQQLGVPAVVARQFAAVVGTSAATREGLQELQQAVLRLAGAPQLTPGGVSWAVNERQGEALIRASEALHRVQESIANELPIDFWTIDLRAAALALGEVSGDEVTEEVIDSIFSRFCIGK